MGKEYEPKLEQPFTLITAKDGKKAGSHRVKGKIPFFDLSLVQSQTDIIGQSPIDPDSLLKDVRTLAALSRRSKRT